MSENTTHTFSILPARNLDKLLDIADLLGLEKKWSSLRDLCGGTTTHHFRTTNCKV